MCCARHARDIRVAFPSLSQAARSLWCLLQGLVAGRAQRTCEVPSSPDVQGQSRHRPSPCLCCQREEAARLEGQTADLAFPEPVLAVLQGVVHLISAWHLHGFSQLSLLRGKCENLKEKE